MDLRRVLVKIVWPWFKKHVWPIISEFIISMVRSLVEDLTRMVEEWLANRQQREQEAISKAEAASHSYKQAADSADSTEAEVQRRVEEIWRQVAESMRTENETLRTQISALLHKADKVARDVKEVDIDAQGDQPALLLGGQTIPLLDSGKQAPTLTCPHCGSPIR